MDPDLASGLHRENLVDTFTWPAISSNRSQPLHVRLNAFPPGARTTTADGVCRLHQDSFNRTHFDLVVVRLDSMHDVGMLAVLPSQIGPDDRVRPLDLVGQCLADVMQERGRLQ
jgi:hypothetical protein